MVTLQQTLKDIHDWSHSRINHLVMNAMDLKDPELVENADCIRREFNEWLDPNIDDHDIFSMEYIGEGSDYE